jgi:Sec-independent protein translocase protein TatA
MRGSVLELLLVAVIAIVLLVVSGKGNKVVEFSKALRESKKILTENEKKEDSEKEEQPVVTETTEAKEQNA